MDLSQRGEMQSGRETRSMAFQETEIREKPDGTGGTTVEFNGYASVTETPYEMHDMFGPYTEIVRKGAFAKTIADGADVAFLINHEGPTLARTKSGTLRLAEDQTGLHVNADLDAGRAEVQGLRSAISRKDVDEMSFAFRTIRQEWSPDYDQRDLIELSLDKGDVSAVNYGANPFTSGPGVSLRSLKATRELAGRHTDDEWRQILEALHDLPADEAVRRLACDGGPPAPELFEGLDADQWRQVAEFLESTTTPARTGPSDLYRARAHALRLRAAQ